MAKNEDWITEELTKEALNLFQKKKSPGPDEIKPVIFEHLPLKFIRHLVFYLQKCHLTQIYTQTLEEYKGNLYS